MVAAWARAWGVLMSELESAAASTLQEAQGADHLSAQAHRDHVHRSKAGSNGSRPGPGPGSDRQVSADHRAPADEGVDAEPPLVLELEQLEDMSAFVSTRR